MKKSLYIFGWPSHLGGADTKLAHLLELLHKDFTITVMPNFSHQLQETFWTNFLDQLGIRYTRKESLPPQLDGVALSLCNDLFFSSGICRFAKNRGLKVIWSSEMMWHHQGELEHVQQGLVDRVLFTSPLQKAHLQYPDSLSGILTGNYINPEKFPFCERNNSVLTIGRLSRRDPKKYPEDFPVFYECLDLPEVRFRVMAWSPELAHKYRWHHFDERWDLLNEGAEETCSFLQSLDLFVYPLGHEFIESWGRSTVEAMLTGAIPLVPDGHHLENLIIHGETGFICQDFKDYQNTAHGLNRNLERRRRLAKQCREHAVNNLCNRQQHLQQWKEALDV